MHLLNSNVIHILQRLLNDDIQMTHILYSGKVTYFNHFYIRVFFFEKKILMYKIFVHKLKPTSHLQDLIMEDNKKPWYRCSHCNFATIKIVILFYQKKKLHLIPFHPFIHKRILNTN